MAFRFKHGDCSVEAALRRMAGEQVDKALASLEGRHRAEAVHDVRKRCKKLRALVRLVRPVFDGYAFENGEFRDIAKIVSGARDAKVMQDTYDRLVHAYRDEIDRRTFSSIRRRFTHERKKEVEPADVEEAFGQLAGRLRDARDRIEGWQLAAQEWDVIGPGLAKSLKQARKAAGIAAAEPGAEAFHELRKHVKYHWYHVRMLSPLWPDAMAVCEEAAKQAAELLGDHHDLWVLERRLSADPDMFGKPSDIMLACSLAQRERERIEAQAWPPVERLLAEPPQALAAHWGKLWAIWRDEPGRLERLNP